MAVIILCQEAGFTLAEIAELLATRGEQTWKELVRRKLEDTRRQAFSRRSPTASSTHSTARVPMSCNASTSGVFSAPPSSRTAATPDSSSTDWTRGRPQRSGA